MKTLDAFSIRVSIGFCCYKNKVGTNRVLIKKHVILIDSSYKEAVMKRVSLL